MSSKKKSKEVADVDGIAIILWAYERIPSTCFADIMLFTLQDFFFSSLELKISLVNVMKFACKILQFR